MLEKLRRNDQKGWSLLELMIVLGILAILFAIAIPNFVRYRSRGICEGLEKEAKTFYSIAVAYISDTGTTKELIVTDTSYGYGASDIFNSSGGLKKGANGALQGGAVFEYKKHIVYINEFGVAECYSASDFPFPVTN